MMKSFSAPSPRTHRSSLQPLIESKHLTAQQVARLDFLERGNLESPIVQHFIIIEKLTVANAKKLNPTQRLNLEDRLVQALIAHGIISFEKALTLTLTQRVSLEQPTLRQQIHGFQKNIERATDAFLHENPGLTLSTMKTTEQKVEAILTAIQTPLLEQYRQAFATSSIYGVKENEQQATAFVALIDTAQEIILNRCITHQERLLSTAELAKDTINDAYCENGDLSTTPELTDRKSFSWQSTSWRSTSWQTTPWQFPLFTSRQNSREEALQQPLLTTTNPLQNPVQNNASSKYSY